MWMEVFPMRLLPKCALALALLTVLAMPRPLRLHVIASSNSPDDQAVKLEVRDALLGAMNELGSPRNKEDARRIVLQNGSALQSAVEDTLSRAGMDYPATLCLGPAEFPDRQYAGSFYPAGEYDALRVVLGEGKGQNWWCVIYPPLCLGDLKEEPANGIQFQSLLVELLTKLGILSKDSASQT